MHKFSILKFFLKSCVFREEQTLSISAVVLHMHTCVVSLSPSLPPEMTSSHQDDKNNSDDNTFPFLMITFLTMTHLTEMCLILI